MVTWYTCLKLKSRGNRGGSILINHAANSDLHQMKRMTYKENGTYRYEISDRHVLCKPECFFRRMKGAWKLFSLGPQKWSYRWIKKVNLVSLYIYPKTYHSAVKNGPVLGFSTYDSKIKSVKICTILSNTSEISHQPCVIRV